MAFPWDDVQQRWLERRLAGSARRFESKVQVAGSSLEIDAAAEHAGPDEFFDFLGELALFENKAPSEVFGEVDLYLVSARTLLYAAQQRLELSALEKVTQVVLCSQVTAKLRRRLKERELRPGVWEARFSGRLLVVEANALEVCEAALGVLVHFASGAALRRVLERIVRERRTEYYGVLWLLRRKPFQEVLSEMGETLDDTMIDVREAVEELGIEHVIDSVGLSRVIEAVGKNRVIEAVGLPGVIEAAGAEHLLEALGLDRAEQLIQKLRKAAPAKRRKAGKPVGRRSRSPD